MTRSLFLVRHAIAADRSDKWPDDAERPLTHAGAARMRQGVKGLASLDVGIGLVITSPLARAAATADLLVRGLTTTPRLVTSSELAPGGSPAAIAKMLAGHRSRAIALVGHEPGLGELAAWLIGAHHPLPFKKGGICRIDVADWPPAARQGTLIWFTTPKMLRALA
jgi:phosphohistidine phosphatase